MAGAGFEIRKLMGKNTCMSDFKADFFAGLVSSGPWLVSILGLGFLWIFSYPYFGLESQKLARVVITYTYAYSLILTGLTQFILTRFLSDRLFLKQKDIFLPTYIAVIITTVIASGAAAAMFYGFCEVDINFKIGGIILFIAVSCVWQTMIFLSVFKDFETVVSAFFWGNVLSVILASVLVMRAGFNGHLLGYTAGQVVLILFLMHRVFYKFDSAAACSFEFLSSAKKHFDLVLMGIFYYAAIWIDKILYWHSPFGEREGALFFSCDRYDSCMLLAFMAVMPALAHFMAEVETSFYDAYRDFYGTIMNKAPFGEIMKQKKGITKVLEEMLFRVVMLEAVMTGALLFFAPGIADFLRLGKPCVPLIRAAAVGSFFHVLVFSSLVIIFYFGRRRTALFLAFFFMATNAIFTLAAIRFFPDLVGIGYAASTFVSAVFGIFLLFKNVKYLEYLTFVEQPFMKPGFTRPSSEQPDMAGAASEASGASKEK